MNKVGASTLNSEYIVINNTKYKVMKEVINGYVTYQAVTRLSAPVIKVRTTE